MQGASAGGVSGRARELQPRHDHDRPGVRRPDVHRAAHAGVGARRDRTGTPRCAAADDRGSDRAERERRARRIGRPRAPRCRVDRRELGDDPSSGGPQSIQGNDDEGGSGRAARRDRARPRGGAGPRGRARVPGDRPAVVHARRGRERVRGVAGRAHDAGAALARRKPRLRDPRRGVDRRLEGVRARGDARPRRQCCRRLLDRERRSDGRPHRRLRHRCAAADPHGPRVSIDARRRPRVPASDRRRDRRIQRAVRRGSRHRAPGADRDEPSREPFVGTRLEGHRVPHREDRRAPGRRLSVG